MSGPATVLLIDGDPREVETFRATLREETDVRLLVAENGKDGYAAARQERPDLIVAAEPMAGGGVLEFCRTVQADADLALGMLVIITHPGSTELKLSGLRLGIDEYLARPVEPAEIRVKLHGMLRLKRVQDQLRADKRELEQLHHVVSRSFDQLLNLLVRLLDLSLPGTAERGKKIALLAQKIAARFGVPQNFLRDLDVAARLHEIGKLVRLEPGTAGASPAEDWHYTQSTKAVMKQVDGLAEAGELVGSLYENWDGTGHPDHLQQGQIPLRCRILRVLIDFFQAVEGPGRPSLEAVLAELAEHAHTRYDPLVVVHLKAILLGGPAADLAASRVTLPITALRPGMVLAEDLYTESGLKLLARDTVISASTLAAILRRHRLEPLLQGAVVHRPAA